MMSIVFVIVLSVVVGSSSVSEAGKGMPAAIFIVLSKSPSCASVGMGPVTSRVLSSSLSAAAHAAAAAAKALVVTSAVFSKSPS